MSGAELATILTAVFGAFGTILFGFFKYAQSRENHFAKSRDNQAKAFDKSIDKLARALRDNTASNKRIADEAKQRNGHLAELQVKSQELIVAHSKDVEKMSGKIIAAVSNIFEQHVKHQVVDKSDVKTENVEHENIKNKS